MSVDGPTYIYVLCEPDGETVRYVGKTINVEQRYIDHMKESARKRKTHKERWIMSLLVRGEKPVMRVIDVVPPYGDWAAAEAFWIDYYRRHANLTNHTNGGEGVPGLRMSAESRAKMSNVRVGRRFPKLSEAKRGKPIGPHTDETRRKIGDAHRGKTVSDESRQRIGEASCRVNDERRLPDGWTTEMADDLLVILYEQYSAWEPASEAMKRELGFTYSFYRGKRFLQERGVWREPMKSSKYRGVSWDKQREKWSVKLQHKGRTINVGRFDDEHDAARAYNEAAQRHGFPHERFNVICDSIDEAV